IDAVLCKLHYFARDQVEVARICGADYLPYRLEGRAHVRGELGNDLFSAHISFRPGASRRSLAASKIHEAGMSHAAMTAPARIPNAKTATQVTTRSGVSDVKVLGVARE